MATSTSASTAAADKPTKPQPEPRKHNSQDEPKRYRSIFEVPPEFFDSCRLLQSPSSSLPDSHINHVSDESNSQSEIIDNSIDHDTDSSNYMNVSSNSSGGDGKVQLQRWSCNTCKAEFESLVDQRIHFKSDLHRFNIKLSVAGKSIIKEEDFDEAASDSLCKDYDVSSISGSEGEDERDADKKRGFGGISKVKIFIQLQDGERVSIWRCLLLDESENISFESDKLPVMDGPKLFMTQLEVIEKLRYIIREPRDNTRLRIVLLARGGHFAGCVFDGTSLVAHKTFHRYVVRAKAGKKQSSKDAGGGRTIHSAGASLRRYNELALKKDIQELFALWKPHFAAASCIFISAPSDNRQLFYDGEKPYFICQHRAIRNIPLTIRRPTSKEARRIYSLLTQIYPEINEEIPLNTKNEPSSIEVEIIKNLEGTKIPESLPVATEMESLSISDELKEEEESDIIGTSTPLHEAAKSGNAEKVLELLEQGLDPCSKDDKGQTPYMVANEKEVRNNFRRFMALNLEKWDWHAAKVPSPLTKEMEESQAAKQAEKDAKRKAKAKELKKLKKAKEKKAQAEAAQSQNASSTHKGHNQSSGSAIISKEEELRRKQEIEREKRALAAERRIAALKAQENTNLQSNNINGSEPLCSCCHVSLSGKVPFHRYHYKYCSTSCMHVHREILEDEG